MSIRVGEEMRIKKVERRIMRSSSRMSCTQRRIVAEARTKRIIFKSIVYWKTDKLYRSALFNVVCWFRCKKKRQLEQKG